MPPKKPQPPLPNKEDLDPGGVGEALRQANRNFEQARRNVIHLRLDEELRERLQQAADARRFTLTNEIRVRLLDSLDSDATRSLDDIRLDMEISWMRYSSRFLRLDLEVQLAEAIEQASDLNQIKTLARLWLEHRGFDTQHIADRPSASARPDEQRTAPRPRRWTKPTYRRGDPS